MRRWAFMTVTTPMSFSRSLFPFQSLPFFQSLWQISGCEERRGNYSPSSLMNQQLVFPTSIQQSRRQNVALLAESRAKTMRVGGLEKWQLAGQTVEKSGKQPFRVYVFGNLDQSPIFRVLSFLFHQENIKRCSCSCE